MRFQIQDSPFSAIALGAGIDLAPFERRHSVFAPRYLICLRRKEMAMRSERRTVRLLCTSNDTSKTAGLAALVGAVVISMLCPTASAIEKANHEYWLEIASRAEGAFGSQWRTVAVVRNDGSATASVEFVFHRGGSEWTLSREVPAGAQRAFDDIVGQMGAYGTGALEIWSNQPLTVSGRVYNQADSGTFGQAFEGVGAEQGLTAGQDAWLLGLRQETDLFRTNLSVTNLGDSPATVRVRLYRNDGARVANYTLNPGPSQVVQDNQPFFRRAGEPDLGWGFAQITVESGSGIVTSASVVDSRTNDATTIAMKREGCGVELTSGRWYEIAMRGAGAFDSVWRTMVAARNPGADDAIVTFRLHGTSGPAELTTTIRAGAQSVFNDIVGTMGREDKGSIQVRSSQPLDLVGRIYNQGAEGTFGQFLDGVASVNGLATGESAWLQGLRQTSGEYRTNLSVTNTGGRPAQVEVALFDTDGSQVGRYPLSLDAAEVIQDNEPFRTRAGAPNLGWGFAQITVLSGDGVLTSASVIDSRTNDATTIAMKRTRPTLGCAPQFGGITLATATDEGELTIVWTPAIDDTTSPSGMRYEIHLGSSADFQPSPSTLATIVTGGSHAVVQGLAPATQFFLRVVAVDADGQRTASTGGGTWNVSTLEFAPEQRTGAVFQAADGLGLGDATVRGSDLIFQAGGGAHLPEVGAQLVGSFADGGGYLRTVTNATTSGGEIIVGTSTASVEDAFGQFQLLSSASLPDAEEEAKAFTAAWGDDAKALPANLRLSHEVSPTGERTGRMTVGERLLTVETTRHAGTVEGMSYAPTETGGFELLSLDKSGQLTLEAELEFRPELATEATFSWGNLVTAEVIARGSLELSALAEYEWTAAAEYEQTVPIFTTTWVAVYSVGPVPVYQTITLSVEAELSAAASAAITAEAAAAAATIVEVGLRYDQVNGWQPVTGLDFERSLGASLEVVGGANAEIRIVPKLEVEFYEAIASSITIEPYLTGEIEARGNAMPSCTPLQLEKFDFELAAEASVGVDLTIFWRIPVFDETIWTSPTWELFNLPQAEISAAGSGPVDLVAMTTDGTGNLFDQSSARWHVSPSTATITPDHGDPRNAELTCSNDGTYTVTFSGHGVLGPLGRRCVQENVGCTSGGCTYEFDPTESIGFPATGGNDYFVLRTLAECPWTLASSESWIHVAPTTGSGAATITFVVDPNTGGARTGVIVGEGQTFTVSQLAGGGGGGGGGGGQERTHLTYTFERDVGTTVVDESPGGHDGTNHGAVYVEGRTPSNLALEFSEDYVEIPQSAFSEMGSTVYVEAWIRLSRAFGPWPERGTVFLKRAHFNDVEISIHGDGALTCWAYGGPGGVARFDGGSIAVGQWTKVACWFDGEKMRGFIDGLEVDPVPPSTGMPNDPDNFALDWLGGFQFGRIGWGETDSRVAFPGAIDEFCAASHPVGCE